MATYVCHACDEDLTAEVARKTSLEDDDIVFDVLEEAEPSAPERRKWKVMVRCTKGHQNIFDRGGGDDKEPDDVVAEEE